jgi:hypothetical protein
MKKVIYILLFASVSTLLISACAHKPAVLTAATTSRYNINVAPVGGSPLFDGLY